MKFDTYLITHDLQQMPAITQAIEALGFDGIWTAETAHNPFLPLTFAAEHSQRLLLGTGIAVAFPRSPTVLAHIAWDLQRYSQGRFVLGLGTQVKAHIVLRLALAGRNRCARCGRASRPCGPCGQAGGRAARRSTTAASSIRCV